MIALLAAAAIGWPPPVSSWARVQAALRNIPSVAGGSVFDRMKACGVRLNRQDSWVQVNSGAPIAGDRPGDVTLQVLFDAPKMAPGDDPAALNDLLARWTIRSGHAIPTSGWARNFQDKQPPSGSGAWMNC